MKTKYHIGQLVKAVAFTDSFGEYHPEVRMLIVESVTLIGGRSIPDYHRIKAVYSNNPAHFIEAGERFFAPEW